MRRQLLAAGAVATLVVGGGLLTAGPVSAASKLGFTCAASGALQFTPGLTNAARVQSIKVKGNLTNCVGTAPANSSAFSGKLQSKRLSCTDIGKAEPRLARGTLSSIVPTPGWMNSVGGGYKPPPLGGPPPTATIKLTFTGTVPSGRHKGETFVYHWNVKTMLGKCTKAAPLVDMTFSGNLNVH